MKTTIQRTEGKDIKFTFAAEEIRIKIPLTKGEALDGVLLQFAEAINAKLPEKHLTARGRVHLDGGLLKVLLHYGRYGEGKYLGTYWCRIEEPQKVQIRGEVDVQLPPV